MNNNDEMINEYIEDMCKHVIYLIENDRNMIEEVNNHDICNFVSCEECPLNERRLELDLNHCSGLPKTEMYKACQEYLDRFNPLKIQKIVPYKSNLEKTYELAKNLSYTDIKNLTHKLVDLLGDD